MCVAAGVLRDSGGDPAGSDGVDGERSGPALRVAQAKRGGVVMGGKKPRLRKHKAVRREVLGVRTACGGRYLDPSRYSWDWSECTCGLCLRNRPLNEGS